MALLAGDGLAGDAAPARRRPEYGVVFCDLPSRDQRLDRSPSSRAAERVGPQAARRGARAHGTYAKAVIERCPCPRCKAARSAYNHKRRQAMAGEDHVWLPYVSAEPARRHLAALAEAGVGLKTVARLSGVSHGSLSQIVYGAPRLGRPPSRRIRRQTLERILAVHPAQAGGGQRVSAGATWTLIGDLVAAGYTRAYLARALGSQAASPTLQIGRQQVRASTARAVEDLHQRLINRPPPGPWRRP